jgi:O-antigen/teichoic acid export membrane protein
MKQPVSTGGRQLFGGTVRIFTADALLIPTGVLTAAFLSRSLGPAGYGLLTLASVIVACVESNIAAALSRPAVKLVSDAGGEWQPVGSAVLRLYLLAGCGSGLALWASSTPLASLMAEPELSSYLRLLAIDVPLFCAAQAHRSIIVGLGHFRQRALVSVARLLAKLLLVVLFVAVNRSPVGALWGSICASVVEVAACRLYVRPGLFPGGAYPLRRLCGYAWPLVSSALCLSLFERLDLILLKALGGSISDAGIYAVAQNLALLPSLLSFALAPALLSTLRRALRTGDTVAAHELGRQAMRAVVLMLPPAVIIAGAAPELIRLIFGHEFLAAAPVLRLLIFGSLSLLMIAVAMSIMTSAGKHHWTLWVAAPLLTGAFGGHLLLIPLWGAMGAAAVTTALACTGALISLLLVRKLWSIAPPVETLGRSILVCVHVYAIFAWLPAYAPLVILKVAGAAIFVVAAFAVLGEFSAEEIGRARAALRRLRGQQPGITVEAQGQES